MGYESKIIVGVRHEMNSQVWLMPVASFDLCKMGYQVFNYVRFPELFRKPVDFNVTDVESDDDPDSRKRDCYGEICTYTEDIDSVISWLEEFSANNDYWRASLFLDFLKSLRAQNLGKFCLVHYGY